MFKLVPFSEAHFDCLSGWFSSEREVAQWGGSTLSFPLDRAKLGIMSDHRESERPVLLCWMVEHAGRFVGHAQLILDWHNGNARLARVVVAPDKRGQGLAVPMLRQIIWETFALPGMERVDLHVFDWNIPAVRTYERLGFSREGVQRACIRFENERWDMMLMGLLRSEWQGSHAADDEALFP
jgi:RimJ/RimL family protein N-acetyltransferase